MNPFPSDTLRRPKFGTYQLPLLFLKLWEEDIVPLLHSKIFHLGLILRLIAFPILASAYPQDLFIPFLDRALTQAGNPWSLSPPHFFPYGSALFVLLFTPRWLGYKIFGSKVLGTGFAGAFLFKLPLFALDFLLLTLLIRFAPKRRETVLQFYWLNPVLFFITYLHGQLDLAAMTFCILSIHFLISKRIGLSAISMAIGTLCKFHIVAIVPLMLAYLGNRFFLPSALRKIGLWLTIWLGLTALGFLPAIFSEKIGYVTTTSPEAFRLFALNVHLGDGQFLYLGLAFVLIILGRLCISSRLTDEGLFFGSAVVFGTLVLVTRTMPGWYFWVYPFIAVLFATYLNAPKSLYWISCVAYFAYFTLVQNSSLSLLLQDGVFTFLQTLILGLLIVTWVLSIRSNASLQGRTRPFLIGIAGDSGTGKDRLSLILSDLLGKASTVVIAGDDYHKWERGNQKWRDYTHLHPRANALEELSENVQTLLSGRLVFHPHYDHSTGSFTAPREIKPNRHVILQGLHAFYMVQLRKQMGLRIYLEPDPQLRLSWKVKRDTSERGQTIDRVLTQIKNRAADALKHIQPQRELADWIIRVKPAYPLTEEQALQSPPEELVVEHTLRNDITLNPLITLLAEAGVRSKVEACDSRWDRITFTTEGNPTVEQVTEISEKLFPHLKTLVRSPRPPVWQGGQSGIEQLIALLLLECQPTL